MKATVSAKFRIVLPAEIRHRDGIEPGQVFEIERIARGEYRLVRLVPPKDQGLLDWLLACPEKGYFVSVESESTHYGFTSPLTRATSSNNSSSS